MIDMLGESSPVIRDSIGLGLSIAMKATLLILVARAVDLLLGRRRVLVRSVVWNACLLGLLLLPLSAAGFPRLLVNDPRGSMGAPAIGDTASVPTVAKELAPAGKDGVRTLTTLDSILRRPPAPAFDWSSVIIVAYVVVAAGLLGRLALSLRAVGRLKRSSPAVLEPRWALALERWQERLALRREVRLACSARVGLPVVVGWLRPVVVLPDGLVESASVPTIDAVLLHELTHVRRGDYAWNLVLRLVQVLYWPHPLVWLVGRIVAGVREQACDDLCVAWLGGSAPYGEALLEVTAGRFRPPWEALGLGMTRSTKLGRRLARIARSAGTSRCLLRAPARGVIIAVVLAAFGVLGTLTLVRPRADEPKPQPHQSRQQPQDQGPARAHRVRVAQVRPGAIPRTTTQPGSLHAFESADLYAKVSGYLKHQNVDIGDRVVQGAALATIDAPELVKDAERAADAVAQAKVAVNQAQTRVATAESEVTAAKAAVAQVEAEVDRATSNRKYRETETARYKDLLEKNAIPKQIMTEQEEHLSAATASEHAARAAAVKARADVSSTDSRLAQAKADLLQAQRGVPLAENSLERAKLMVAYTRIVSPYDGIVTLRGFHPGDFIRAADAGSSSPLFRVARTDKMRVVVFVPDRDVPYLDPGDPAEITFDALPQQTFQGKVARSAGSEDPSSWTMRTEIDLENRGNKLREGMYGVVRIVLDEGRPGPTIPASAVFVSSRFGSDACFRIVDGRAVETPIKIGIDDGGLVQCLEGVNNGDTVAVDPRADGVKEGEQVGLEER
jgi:RND family efflux transporter MFP subunit